MDDGPVICPACGQSSPRGKRFCGDCGAPLPLSCPACGAANPPGKRFCGDCGTPLASGPPQTLAPLALGASAPTGPAPPVAPPADLERRLATILFADLVDST